MALHRTVLLVLYSLSVAFSAYSDEACSELVVFDGANDVVCSVEEGSINVSFKVKVTFPPTGLLCDLNESMVERGWSARSFDALHPDVPTSMFLGWSESMVSHTAVETEVLASWISTWTNLEGQMVRYEVWFRTSDSNTWWAAAEQPTIDGLRGTIEVTGTVFDTAPNLGVAADRDPRERGSRPLNTNR